MVQILCWPQTWTDLSSTEFLNLSRGMDGVPFTITSIFIHNQVYYAMVSFYKGSTFDHIKVLEFMTVKVHFLEDLERILASDLARPPFDPLCTKEPHVSLET